MFRYKEKGTLKKGLSYLAFLSIMGIRAGFGYGKDCVS
jgi:hypothetical protein